MVKIKPILPSLREKKRYLVFEIISKNRIKSFPSISRAIWDYSLQFLGEKGVAQAGIWLLPDKYNPQTQRGLVRVNNKYVNDLKSVLTLIDQIENKEVIVRSVGVSGILKKAETRYLAS
jgi:ribonuclease P/MRP protein subunit POP5